MGGKKKGGTPGEYKKLETFYNIAMGTSPADISTLLQTISKTIGGRIEDITKNIESIKEQRLRGLQHALTTAVGSVQYNPYAKPITEALEQIRQAKVEPLQKTEQSIVSEYQKINPELAKSLMFAGAYQAIPSLRETVSDEIQKYANLLESYSGQPYQSVMKFFDETKQMLKNLGLTDDEITSAMQPYYSLMEKGKETAINIGFQ